MSSDRVDSNEQGASRDASGDTSPDTSPDISNASVPSRRRFIAGATAAVPIVLTVASKPAQAYECSHSALSSGRGSGRHTKRRNPRACYDQEADSIQSYYQTRISAWQAKLELAEASDDLVAAEQARIKIAALVRERQQKINTLTDTYKSYPGF